ncbi:MAG: beta-N-acetylhexosaminidase [Clostridia bacterium]|nr:beta-N-acetylhexosaminidase [Clostridia bacterium]
MAKRFGVMLDMSRNAVMKPQQVKQFARTVQSFGYNMIQLYTEDTYEITDEPYFGYLRGRYTQEELKDIVSYCNSIGVEIIPCVQVLAHLNQIFRWSDYAPINDVNDILLAGNERTYELIERMFRSLRECFTTNLIHIGMDEAHMLGLGKYLDQNGFRNRFGILQEHLTRVLQIAAKYNFKPMMWSDMFFRLANHDEYHTTKDVITDEIVASCPAGVDMVYWDYYHNEKEVYDAMLASHKKFKGETWFAGGAWCWCGFAPRNDWSIESMSVAMQSCKEQNIDNIFMTMWGDNGKECSFYSVLPALFAIRKIYDGEQDMERIKQEFHAVTGEDFDAMMALDLPDTVGGKKNQSYHANPCKHMLYSDPFNGFLDSTTISGVEKEYAAIAKQLAAYAQNSPSYSYLFDSMAKLCDLLSVKYTLGVRTRKAYVEKDVDAIRKLSDDYTLAMEKLESFYRAFQNLWFTENKPHGFDVQELRLGGLAMRLRSCRERLCDYADGKIDTIPELEEEILSYRPGGFILEGVQTLNSWSKNASVNVI